MTHIVVIGSLNMDLVVRAAHLSAPGETVLGSDFQTIPGGKGANRAVGAARLGANVSMIGRVGADDFGAALRTDLEKAFTQIKNVDVVVLQLEIPLDRVEAAARLGRERGGAKVVLNPAPARQLSDSLLSQTTCSSRTKAKPAC